MTNFDVDTDEDESEAPEPTKEELLALARKEQERLESLRKFRSQEKERFLTPDLSFDDMYRQSVARVYHMKSRNAKCYHPEDAGFAFAGRADKLLTKFKHAKKRKDEFEHRAGLAQAKGEYVLRDSELDKADEYTKNALWCHYGIGVLYGRFLNERTI